MFFIKNKMDEKIKTIILILLIIFGVLITIVAFLGGFDFVYKIVYDEDKITEDRILSECNYQSVVTSGKCVNKYIKAIYNYQLKNDTENITLQMLKDGEDCNGYSLYYGNIMKKLGHNCTRMIIPIETINNLEICHAFTLCYGEDGYILLDGKSRFTFYFEEMDGVVFE